MAWLLMLQLDWCGLWRQDFVFPILYMLDELFLQRLDQFSYFLFRDRIGAIIAIEYECLDGLLP